MSTSIPVAPTVTATRPRILRGNPQDPACSRPALLILLAGAAVLYLVDLGRSCRQRLLCRRGRCG